MLAPGIRLGPYEILAPLGAGGMGEVYRALDARLDRFVAVKVLPDALTKDAEQEARFRREARSVAALSHPNILSIFDTGKEGGIAFVVTELLEGQSLRAALAAGRLGPKRTVEVGAEIARGLEAAHTKGIIHRDLKPENLWITREGRVKILDFGLAKSLFPSRGGAGSVPEDERPTLALSEELQTESGVLVGTPHYMSPEQAMGRPLDARSDLFSLGVILYELLCGERPFIGSSPGEVLAALLRDEPPIPVDGGRLGSDLWRVVHRCLRKAPEDRYARAAEVAQALEAARDHRASGADSVPSPAPRSYGLSSIAVLPFRVVGPDRETDYVGEGITEEIINSLMTLPALHVAARTSSFAFRGQAGDVRAIGRQLGVASVLEGSVRTSGPRLRVTAQLIDVASGYQMWSGRFDRTLDDLFEMQDDIARAITEVLRGRLSEEAVGELAPRAERDAKAYDLYLKGRFFYHRRAASKALPLFQEAIEADPSFSMAYTGLAMAYCIHGFYGGMDTREAWAKSREAVAKAQSLAPGSFHVHLADGIQEYYYGWDLERSERELKLALAANPKDPEPYYWLGLLRGTQGDAAGAKPFLETAASLDPFSIYPIVGASWAQINSGDYRQAKETIARALELDPASVLALWQQSLIHLLLGEPGAAMEPILRTVDLSHRSSFGLGLLAGGHAALGHREEAEAALAELRALPAYAPATHALTAALLLDDRDEVLRLARRIIEDRNAYAWWYLKFNPLAADMKQDPRYLAILEDLVPG